MSSMDVHTRMHALYIDKQSPVAESCRLVTCQPSYNMEFHAHFEREGYCILPDFVSKTTLEYLRNQFNEVWKSRHHACQAAWM